MTVPPLESQGLIMTHAEALSILQQVDGHGFIGWDEAQSIPDVSTGTIVLDGAFSEQELRALLVFFSDSSTSFR